MKLCNLRLNFFYNSLTNNTVEEFYKPAISHCLYYDRVSAYFDSKILAMYAAGLENMINKNGKIRFIFSFDISEEDFQLMKNGYANRLALEAQISEHFNNEGLTEIDKKRLSNIAYLIEVGLVDVKIAVTKHGIFHDKFGLIYDEDDAIYFRGSNNETSASINYNYENFEVSTTWDGSRSELSKIENAKNIFNKLWNNTTNGIEVIELPEVIRSKIETYKKQIKIDYSNSTDCIILMCENGEYKVINKYENFSFDNDFDYKVYIKNNISRFENKGFVCNIPYTKMKNFNAIFERICENNDLHLIIDDSLLDYIESMDMMIHSRRELGINIKNRHDSIIKEYMNFDRLIEKELFRKMKENQKWDAFHIVTMRSGANFSVPGAGKTSIVYTAFAYLNSSEIDDVDKIVMIGPKNAFLAWKDEFYECFRDKKQLNVLDIHDEMYNDKNGRISAIRFDSGDKNLILVNYESLKTLSEPLLEIINDRTLLVFDEVHRIKAVDGQYSSRAISISKKAKYKIVLTGTPIPNSYKDLYTLLNIMFSDDYNSFFKYTPKDLECPNEITAEEINKKIYPFYCRTTKSDLSIPAPNEDITIDVEMTNQEEELFKMLHKKFRLNTLLLYIRMLQATTNPKLLLNGIDNTFIDEFYGTEEKENIDERMGPINDVSFTNEEIAFIKTFGMSNKFYKSLEIVEKLVTEGKPVIVWGIFINTLNEVVEHLSKKNIRVRKIDGSVGQNERVNIIEDFKKLKFSVLVTNPHTLAESVSLHKVCHDAIYLEYSFNLTHLLQSRDRINRLGLEANQYTQYYFPRLKSNSNSLPSLDEITYLRLKEKEKIMLRSIEGTALEPVEFSDMNEIRKILKNFK